MATQRLCSVEGCGKPRHAHGYCSMHAARWRRHGDPRVDFVSPAAAGEPLGWMRQHVNYRSDECLKWPYGRTPFGYGMLTADGKHQGAHRWLCEQLNGPPPSPKHHAAHSCGNGHLGCVNGSHLYWASPIENAQDRQSHSRRQMGETANRAKLSNAEVMEIYALQCFQSQRAVARKYDVSKATIQRIWHGTTWSHVTGAPNDSARAWRESRRMERAAKRARAA